MQNNRNTVSDILKEELKKRTLAVGEQLTVEELFDPVKVAAWIRHLLDSDDLSHLNDRISMATSERLSHAAATYLLGIALREHLLLNFDFLPRIFPHGTVGDAFYFFWSAICLCHDLGYLYEHDGCSKDRIYDPDLMETSAGRCALLNIRSDHDLLELDALKLKELGIKPGSEEKWVLESLKLAKNYSRMRRKAVEDDRSQALIDHGIAGALILYDVLMNEYMRLEHSSDVTEGIRRNPAELQPVHMGVLSANAGYKRFSACAVIIACTVARHNMWNAEKNETVDYYKKYGLDALCGDAIQICAEQPMEQLLFLLDFMDTIDPVKGMYTRRAENHTPLDVLESWRSTLLNSVFIEFQEDTWQFRWRKALKYRTLKISIDTAETEEKRRGFSDYAQSIAGMEGWLKTKAPVLLTDKDGLVSSITCFYPSFPCQERIWEGNIREYEVTSLCLYAGSGSNKAGFFYQCHNAYQSFNLLMMDGLKGEEARVCLEGQKPYGLYIQEWERTLEVMTDIFTAQCKYMQCHPIPLDCTLRRVDRQVNFDMLKDKGETFAFTSTSKAGFLPEIAASKKNIVLLNIKLNFPIPFVDYGGLLKEAYIYSNEQEVLLPPFLKVSDIQLSALTSDGRKVPTYTVWLDGLSIYKVIKNSLDTKSVDHGGGN